MAISVEPKVAPQQQNTTGGNNTFAFIVVTGLFFMWGFLTVLNDILIPHLKGLFDLNYTQASLVQFAFFAAYFIVSLPAGKIIEKVGYQNGIVLGLLIAATGTFLFYPAAEIRVFPLFLMALVVLASGITILQVAANPYVSILGKPEKAASRLNLAQALNSLGTTLGSKFGQIFILANVIFYTADELAALSPEQVLEAEAKTAASIQGPYVSFGIALVVMAVIMKLVKLPVINTSSPKTETTTTSKKSIWSFTHLILGVVAIFMYVGSEVSIGSFLVNYIMEKSTLPIEEADAAKWLPYFWGGLMVGRFIGSALSARFKASSILTIFSVSCVALIVTSMSLEGMPAIYAMVATGLFLSVMFPTIFTLAIHKLGVHTSQGSSLLVMAIVGGALLPVLMGFVADSISLNVAFTVPFIGILYIAFYGWKGSEPKGVE
ncbi:L-fucose:H+ symporter permease [Limibacter armeniacum]|uniref:L-fucose:H+ symporter permease n=1 Tax=Limibacter armeniacum TaxID=466084 RepID=UPI002FE555BA